MTAHLLGLQAQENLAPYLSLAARLNGFDPPTFSRAIQDRDVVRVLSLRGTVHALTGADAHTLRPRVQAALDRVSRSNPGSRPARDVESADLVVAVGRAPVDLVRRYLRA